MVQEADCCVRQIISDVCHVEQECRSCGESAQKAQLQEGEVDHEDDAAYLSEWRSLAERTNVINLFDFQENVDQSYDQTNLH